MVLLVSGYIFYQKQVPVIYMNLLCILLKVDFMNNVAILVSPLLTDLWLPIVNKSITQYGCFLINYM